jgi:hypothetical protein
MPIPNGVTTVTVNIVPPDGVRAGDVKIDVAPTVPLVWSATGDTLANIIASDGDLVLALPAVNQAGFVTSAGSAFQNWQYLLTFSGKLGGVPFSESRLIKVFSSQTSVDVTFLDMIDQKAVDTRVASVGTTLYAPVSAIKSGVVLTVAAADTVASLKAKADYVCTAAGDLATIQSALDALPDNAAVSGEVLLMAGNYQDLTNNTVSISSPSSSSIAVRKVLRFQRGARLNVGGRTGRKAVIKVESPNCQIINANISNNVTKGNGTGIAIGGDVATFGGRYDKVANMVRIIEPILSNLETGIEFASIDGGPGVGGSTGDCYGQGGYIFACKTGIRCPGYSNAWYSPQISDCDVNIWVEGRRLEAQFQCYAGRLVNWAQQAIRVDGGWGSNFYDTWMEHTSTRSAVPTEAILIGNDADGANSVRFTGSTQIQLFDELYAVRIEKAMGLIFDEIVVSTSGATPITSIIRNNTPSTSENNVIKRIMFGPVTPPAHTLVSGSGTGHLRIERKPGATAFASTPVDPEKLTIPTSGMSLVIGTPALGLSSRTPVWLLDQTAAESVGGALTIPSEWKTADVDLYWCGIGAGSGDVRVRFDYGTVTEGVAAPDPASGTLVTGTGAGDGVVVKTRLATGKTVTPGLSAFEVVRTGGDAGDTLATDIGVICLVITRAT